MKFKLALTAFLFMPFMFLQAQDAALPSMVYPVPGQRVHLQFTYPIEFILKSVGTVAIPANTLMTLDLLFDGALYNTYNLTYPSKLNVGDSISVTIPALTFSTPNPTIEACVIVHLPGDKNKDNDTICNLLHFSIDNNVDLSPTGIDIVIPVVDSIIKPGESIYKLTAKVSNMGTVTLPRDYTVKAETKMNNQTRSFSDKTKTALDTSSYFDMNLLGSQPPVQSKQGPFQICVTLVNNTDDKNSSNDEYCQTFYAYDWTAVAEEKTEEINSFESQGQIHLSNTGSDIMTLMIYNTGGQLVLQKQLKPSDYQGIINVSHFDKGVYILNILSQERIIHSNKFSID